ncbi:hypothetical protein ElyMa_004148700 [Elysia marginata]|uniref:Uncharacterized protein n=1 Tax=Elysia marginata TaxID=1093978 RepID=A0AAV4GG17_9GAST|nr:hypothetical protein ElyMa_004148700 [Elysia marginata]
MSSQSEAGIPLGRLFGQSEVGIPLARITLGKRGESLAPQTAAPDDSDGERVSPISEEIEEAISSDDERGKLDSGVKPLKLFKPGETLVLEFQPLPSKSKSKTNLSAPRKKDSEPVSLYSSKHEASKKSSIQVSSTKAHAMKTFEHSGATKASRPISANRKSSESKADSTAEANAVMKALQEENKKAELFSKVSSSRPLPQPKGPASKSPSTPEVKVPSPVKSSAQPEQTRASSGGVAGSQSMNALDDEDSINHAIERVLKMNSK